MQSEVNALKSMHDIIVRMNNGNAYFSWINVVPDCPCDEDFEYIASDKELLQDVVDLFRKLVDRYGKDGIIIGGKVY